MRAERGLETGLRTSVRWRFFLAWASCDRAVKLTAYAMAAVPEKTCFHGTESGRSTPDRPRRRAWRSGSGRPAAPGPEVTKWDIMTYLLEFVSCSTS